MIEGVNVLSDKKLAMKNVHNRFRLLTINLKETDRELIKTAYNSGLSNIRIDNDIPSNIESRDTSCIYPEAGEGVW